MTPLPVVALLSLALSAGNADEGNAKPPPPPFAWKPGDNWLVRVTDFGQEGKERSYQVQVIVTALQKGRGGEADRWRFELLPRKAPPDLGGGLRVLLHPTSGALTVYPRTKQVP